MKPDPKIDTIPLLTPRFSLSQPAVLTMKWLSRSARVSWSLGIGERHPEYFTYTAFLDTGWTEQLAARLNRDGYRWPKGARVINVEKADLGIVSTTTAEFVRDSLPEVFEKATHLYHRMIIAARPPDPVQIDMGAGSD
jgi:hypothetical protein